jgi:hypothetical protein
MKSVKKFLVMTLLVMASAVYAMDDAAQKSLEVLKNCAANSADLRNKNMPGVLEFLVIEDCVHRFGEITTKDENNRVVHCFNWVWQR